MRATGVVPAGPGPAAAPHALTGRTAPTLPARLLGLQRAAGNRAVAALAAGRRPAVQRDESGATNKRQVWDVVQLTLFVNTSTIVLDLHDGSQRTMQATHNGRPKSGTYNARRDSRGKVRTTQPLGGITDEKGNVISWVTPRGISLEFDDPFLLTVSTAHHDLRLPGPDPASPPAPHERLYFRAERGWGTAADRETRLVGDRIVDWAKGSSYPATGSRDSMWRQYLRPTGAGEVADQLQLHLVARIRDGPARNPITGKIEPDDFEGSPRAREDGVARLTRRWPAVREAIVGHARTTFDDQLQAAVARMPAWAELVTDPKQVEDSHRQPITGRRKLHPMSSIALAVGDDFLGGKATIADLTYESELAYATRVFFRYRDKDLWLYSVGSGHFTDVNTQVREVFGQVADKARFAGLLWPHLVKMMGVGAGFAGGWAATIAGLAIEELGEEGSRQVQGQKPRSVLEIVESVGVQAFIEGVLHVGMKVSRAAVPPRPKPGTLVTIGDFQARAAQNLRETLETYEGPIVDRALLEGRARAPKDGDPSIVREVEVKIDGNNHTYRQKADGTFCRRSPLPEVCDLMPRVTGGTTPKAQTSAADTVPATQLRKELREKLEANVKDIEGRIAEVRKAKDKVDRRLKAIHDELRTTKDAGRRAKLLEQRENLKTFRKDELEGGDLGARYLEAKRLLKGTEQDYFDKLTGSAAGRKEYQAVKDVRVDEAFSTGTARAPFEVEHVFPRSRIFKIQGFERLSWDQQVAIFNFRPNLKLIPAAANKARSNLPYASVARDKWPAYVTDEKIRDLADLERRMELAITDMVKNPNKIPTR